MSSLLRLERKQKKIYLKVFRIRIFLFLSYSFGSETINTFIPFHSSLKNRNGQNVNPFSNQKGPKTTPLGAARTFMAFITEYSPGPNFSSSGSQEK